MTGLAHPDLNRIAAGTDRFLGRVLVLGRDHHRLPRGLEDGLMAFLRLHATNHARRYRTGIAIDRDSLEAGVRQGFTCVEAALQAAAGDDVEQAIDLLADSDLEDLRRQGWERAWNSLDEMRLESAAHLRGPWPELLDEWRPELERWTTLVPESWTAAGTGGAPEPVDPAAEFARYLHVSERARFLASLPEDALRPLVRRWHPPADFPLLLRHLVAALALDRLRLPVARAGIERFAATCFDGPAMAAPVRGKVLQQLEGHLQAQPPETTEERPTLPVPRGRVTVLDETKGQIELLENAEGPARVNLLKLPGPGLRG